MLRRLSYALRLVVVICVILSMLLPGAAVFAPSVALAQNDPAQVGVGQR